jgi:hypothetical protein
MLIRFRYPLATRTKAELLAFLPHLERKISSLRPKKYALDPA